MQEKIRENEVGKFKLGLWITDLILNFQSLNNNTNYGGMMTRFQILYCPYPINYYISYQNRKLHKYLVRPGYTYKPRAAHIYH